jgi:hypothetical protein
MTPGQTIKLVADVFETAEADVEIFDRRLQEAGLRTSTGGRGTSAPHVCADDVIRLTLAVLIVKRPARTAATITEWWAFPLASERLKRSEKAVLPPKLRAAIDNVTLGEALSALLQDCVDANLDSIEFDVELIPHDKRAYLKFSDGKTEIVLTFGGLLDTDESRERFLTTHLIYQDAFVELAKAMRVA